MDSEDKFRTLEPLLQGFAHEIRNPIQGILASADALAFRFEENDPGAQLLKMIQRECVRINSILGDLLNLTCPVQIDTVKALPLHMFLKEATRNFQQQKGSTPSIHTDIPGDLPGIFADPYSLHRAVAALLENAVDSRQEGVSIRVAAERAGSEIKIYIQDNGEGIEAADREKIFQPFFSTRPRKAGLGLSIADRIVRLHGGRISIESTRGEGTSVTVFMPAVT